MASYKQSLSHWCVSKASDAEFKAIYDMGVRGIELAPQNQWQKFRDMGFTIASAGGHGTIESGLNRRENHSRIFDEIRANLELAKPFEIPNLIVFSGNRAGLSDQEGAEICVEGLNAVKADAEAAGVTLIMELLNSKVDHKDYQCDHTAWGAGVVKAVNSPRVKLLYDIYHMQIMEGDLIRTIRENIEHIAHFHTAGNPGRNDLDGNQEIYHPPIARAINELGYSGFIGHEFVPKKPVLEAIKEAFDQFDV
jgi:hydroxypyruvate isomerase